MKKIYRHVQMITEKNIFEMQVFIEICSNDYDQSYIHYIFSSYLFLFVNTITARRNMYELDKCKQTQSLGATSINRSRMKYH